ncbi:MAG: DNA helicase Rep [Thiohalomonadaceae bacterium]
MLNLNPPQQEAVRYIDGPLLVLAGAGSGKTRVITQKIAWLIRSCGLSPQHIAAVTFTNKAAREMKERVAQLLSRKESRGLRVSTFHTLGLDIIRREARHLGYKPSFSIFDATDSANLLKELLHQESIHEDLLKEIQQQISRWKNAFISTEQAVKLASSEGELRTARLYAVYNRHLKAYNALDFDDLIMWPVHLFMQQTEILEHWQNRTRHLLVDEYQDTNATQYQLIKLLCGPRAALTVVGDDDQSIYAWRGAQPENLALLKDDFPQLKVIKLEQNYRSTGCILKAANQLITNNPHIFIKRLWSQHGYGEPIRVISCADEEDEAVQVAGLIISHKFKHRTDYRDYAILYRGNHQSRLFEKALREQRIPYTLSGGTSFFDHSEIKDVLAYLKLLINPDDDMAFLRAVNTPRREIGPVTLEKLGAYANQRGISLFTACFELGLKQQLSERAHARLENFVHWLVDIGDRAKRGDPLQAVRDLVQEIDYESYLKDTTKDLKAAERRMGNVHELLGWIKRMAELEESAEVDITLLVNKICLIDMLDRNDNEANSDTVRLMTLHAAKGLEFPHVFLVGIEEELLPHRNSIELETIEEERRLAYVGITRAQKTLTITVATRRRRGGELVRCEPSRFLQELPQEDLQWEGAGIELPAEVRQERGKAQLANLKGMLRG